MKRPACKPPADVDRPTATPRELVEGEDYYIENGLWVFTEQFHLRRGKCCQSGCRHCPYRDRPPMQQN